MRFASFIAAGIFALTATAQTTTTMMATDMTTTSSAAAATTDPSQIAIQDCLAQCGTNDVNCKAHCIDVPSPDTSSVNATTQCVAACPKGNGTAADNSAYATCINDCINQYYYSTSLGTPQSTTQGSGSGSASVTAVVSAIVSTITSGGSTITTTLGSTTVPVTGSKTVSGSSASPTSSNAADAMFRPMASSVGLLGFLAALLAL